MKTKIIFALLTIIPLYGFSENNAIQNYYKGDYVAAEAGLTELANKNNEAAFYLGKMYLQGYGVNKDKQKGLDLVLKAAKQNYVPAQVFLGQYYLNENNNFEEAFEWYKKAADLGNIEGQMFCGTSYLYGYGVKKDTEKARKYIIKAAQNGDALAQYELANLFFNNKRFKDKGLGMLWLAKSAAKGNANAQHLLGVFKLTGTRTDQNILEALKLLNESAKQGNAKAEFALAMYYLTNNDFNSLQLATYWLDKNLQTTNELLPKKQIVVNAQDNNTPKIFSNRNNSAAANTAERSFADWLKLAEEGDAVAAQQVGYKYFKGDGVAVNKELGIKWLTYAATKNDFAAKIQLEDIQKQWLNTATLKESTVLTPRMAEIKKSQVFNQAYEIANPRTLPIEDIITFLGKKNYTPDTKKLVIPTLAPTEQEKLKANITEILREANLGYAPSQFKLGLAYQYGIGVDKDIPKAVELFQTSAKQNYLQAEYALGVLAFSGIGVPKDYDVAQMWLTKAALKGSGEAQYLLAQLYELGYGADSKNAISKNLTAAKIMYGLAANNNNAEAQYNLAKLYISGLLDQDDFMAQQKNVQLAYSLFKEAAAKIPDAKIQLALFNLNRSISQANQQEAFNTAQTLAVNNNPEGKLLLALMYDRGFGTPINKEKAIELYQKLAEVENPVAQYILGSDYALGDGVEKDMTLARDYLTKASSAGLGYANYNLAVLNYNQNDVASFLVLLKLAQQQGYPPASILLADYYLTNETDPTYIKQAIDIYEKLANGGNAAAQIKLGYMAQHGIFCPVNYQAAIAWYQKAAEQNNPLAQFALGEMSQLGQGTERDLTAATAWYEKAAKQQFAPAQIALGYINEVDRQDYQQARTWYELAAKNNKCPIAEYNLAILYDYGKGVPVNPEKAKVLFESAKQQGL